MKWIGGVQRALDLIEQNLTGEIDYAHLAQVACCSEYNFMRVFSVLSGYTLADYIRCRRLTMAGQELIASDIRILDLALKYGYDSPEAFRSVTAFCPRRRASRARCCARSPLCT